MLSAVSPFPSLSMAQNAALRGMQRAEAQAADAAFAIVRAGTATPLQLGRAEVRALEAGPDALQGLAQMHQARLAYQANAQVLRGADAASAALLRWSV
jgi:hypothetical protein